MYIKIKTKRRALLLVLFAVLLGMIYYWIQPNLVNLFSKPSKATLGGGTIHSSLHQEETFPSSSPALSRYILPVINQEDLSSERFQRPSKALPYPNPYTFSHFEKDNEAPPLVAEKFENPEDLILAYYGILREASNMLGYSGGCGTIGESGLPYPYAYELLTKGKQKAMPFGQYVDSFSGIGYTTLLKLIPAYASPDTPNNVKYYMVEIEVITGAEVKEDEGDSQGSQFAYYYGLVEAEKTPEAGWKIKDIYYIPEDFLCAPTHSWFYLSDAVVEIVYGGNLELIDQIDRREQNGDMVSIYASGKGKSYRFDFVRLTNGYDILLHEYIFQDGGWKETSLLRDGWENMKLTVENSQLNETFHWCQRPQPRSIS